MDPLRYCHDIFIYARPVGLVLFISPGLSFGRVSMTMSMRDISSRAKCACGGGGGVRGLIGRAYSTKLLPGCKQTKRNTSAGRPNNSSNRAIRDIAPRTCTNCAQPDDDIYCDSHRAGGLVSDRLRGCTGAAMFYCSVDELPARPSASARGKGPPHRPKG